MENEKFLYTRFQIFGLLTEGNKPQKVSEYTQIVAEEKALQSELESASSVIPTRESQPALEVFEAPLFKDSAQDSSLEAPSRLGHGTKEMTPLLPCLNRVVVRTEHEEKCRYILKIHYDEYQYKTVVIGPDTTALAVCGLLASKLALRRFTFRLYGIRRHNELHCFQDDQSVSETLLNLMEPGESQPSIRLQVLRPPPYGTNPTMRTAVITRWLNYCLRDTGISVKNIKSDLEDGRVLCALAEVLSGGTRTVDRNGGLKVAIDAFEAIGITLPPEAMTQIQSGSSKKISALLWSILYRYAISQKSLGSENQKKSAPELFDWCATLTQTYEAVQVADFNRSWRDGLALSAILEQYDSYRVSYLSIYHMESVPERLESLFYALDKYFDLPALITAKELQQSATNVDDMAIIIFLTVATLHLHSKKSNKSKRASVVKGVGEFEGQAPVRLFVEGLDNVSTKVLLLDKRVFVYDLRRLASEKMNIPPSTFWIYITESQVERLAQEDEMITLGDTISITIKMVSGSSYYNADTIKSEDSPKRKRRGSINFKVFKRSSSKPTV